METIQWDDELAANSKAYSDLCNYQHSDQVNFSNVKYEYGENLYISSNLNITHAIERSSNAWAGEHEDYDHDSTKCVGEMCGHYTQMVWEMTTRVGCSLSICDKFNNREEYEQAGIYVVCQYYPMGNYKDQAPYSYVNTGTAEDQEQNQTIGDLCNENTPVDPETGLCTTFPDICQEEQHRNNNIFGKSRCQNKGQCLTDSSKSPNTYTCLCKDNFDGKWCETSRCQIETIESTGLSYRSFISNQMVDPKTNAPFAFWDDEGNKHPKMSEGIIWCQLNDNCAGLVRGQYGQEDSSPWVWLAVKNIDSQRIEGDSRNKIIFNKCDDLPMEQSPSLDAPSAVFVDVEEDEVVAEDRNSSPSTPDYDAENDIVIAEEEDEVEEENEYYEEDAETIADELAFEVEEEIEEEEANDEVIGQEEAVEEVIAEEPEQASEEVTAEEPEQASEEVTAEEPEESVEALQEETVEEITADEPEETLEEIVAEESDEAVDQIISEEPREVIEETATEEPAEILEIPKEHENKKATCSCQNGTPSTLACKHNNANTCRACNVGYRLEKRHCKKMGFMEAFKARFESFIFRLSSMFR